MLEVLATIIVELLVLELLVGLFVGLFGDGGGGYSKVGADGKLTITL
jgi:hypothetical protein